MKKIKKISIVFILIIACFTAGLSLCLKRSAFADEQASSPDEYFDVYISKYRPNAEEGEKYDERDSSSPAFTDDSVYLLESFDAVTVTLGKNTDEFSYQDKIVNLTTSVTINNVSFNIDDQSATLTNYGMEREETQEAEFMLRINPEIGSIFVYGKYTLSFSFYYNDDNQGLVYTTYIKSFYILNSQSYNNNFEFYNFNEQSDYINGIFYSNYSCGNNNTDIAYLKYDYRFYDVLLVKQNQGITSSTTLTYRGEELNIFSTNELGNVSETPVAKITKGEDYFVYVTLNDLGTYYFTYTPVCPYTSFETLSNFYNGRLTQKTDNVAYVFGYQLYYTSSNSLEEFKKTKDGVPYIIDSFSMTADITSKVNGLLEGDINRIFNANGDSSPVIPAKTNQAPVYFISNVNLESASYYYFSQENNFTNLSSGEKVENYTGTPLSKTGIYLVEFNYNHTSLGSDNTFTQYFLFRLTNDAPVINTYVLKTDSNGDIVYDDAGVPLKENIDSDQFTYKDVYITKSSLGIFDSSSTLTIYKDNLFNGNYDGGTVIDDNEIYTASETAKYKLSLTYGNSNKKGFTSYFVIDKTEISGIKINTLYKNFNNLYYLFGEIDNYSFTSSPVALSWNNKPSGVKTFAEYKFFPTVYSANNEASLTSQNLKVLYNSQLDGIQTNKYSLPSTNVISYSGGNLPLSDYSNALGKTEFAQSEILTAGGIYIFHIYDDTGAEGKYIAFFIDKTPATIVKTTDIITGTYEIALNNTFTSLDTTLLFGKNKLIKIDCDRTLDWDTWLTEYLTENNSATFRNEIYIKIPVNASIYMQKDDVRGTYTLTSSNNFAYSISAYNTDGSPNESEYTFYEICTSKDTYSPYSKTEFYYYKENYDAKHTIVYSTDNSKMQVYYNDNGNILLNQIYVVKDTDNNNENRKTNFYNPTGQTQLVNSNELLYFKYTTVTSNNLTVESIKINYYPFVKDTQNKTYKFNDIPGSVISIFEYGSLNKGVIVNNELNTYKYTINPEQYNFSNSRTASGKYEIIRTYLGGGVENDPTVRRLVFIVDRNGIISSPDTDIQGNQIYYTGGGISLQVIGGMDNFYDSQTLNFYDIYYASKLNINNLTPVLTTNFMPVTIYIPQYKYGYVTPENVLGAKFKNEDSIVKYYETEENNYRYYPNYKLRAVVYYYPTDSNKYTESYIYDGSNVINEFINEKDSGNILKSFNSAGKYLVRITNDANDEFTFVFEIKAEEPNFELLNTDNTNVFNQNDIYYTNKNTIRIAWKNSASKFLSTINENEIRYTVNEKTYILNTGVYEVISSGDNNYYVDFNLSDLGLYNDNTVVDITLQFKGEQKDYIDQRYFAKTVRLIVDLQAPLDNLTRLVELTGLSGSKLREYVSGQFNKYNVSAKTGLLKNFAYTVDYSMLTNIIKTPLETNNNYYRTYIRLLTKNGQNIKYLAGYEVETDISLQDIYGKINYELFADTGYNYINLYENGVNLFKANIGNYIEIIEEDYAGNRTVYTILITDLLNLSNKDLDMLKYKHTTNTTDGEVEESITNSVMVDSLNNLGEINLYSKNSFKLSYINTLFTEKLDDLKWSVIKVKNNFYVKSPYTYGLYYSLSDYKENESNTSYTLEQLSTLESSSKLQEILITNNPIYSTIKLNIHVLSESLSYYKISQIENDMIEGIYIRIPKGNNSDNLIYATSLKIVGNINNYSSEIVNFTGNSANFLKEEEIKQTQLLDISYKNIGTNKYVRIELKQNISLNDYFIYTITDNFGDKYTIINIYGRTIIKEPIISDEFYTEYYDGYYTTGDISYKYDTTIYNKAVVNVTETIKGSVENRTYVITKNNIGYTIKAIVGIDEYDVDLNNPTKITFVHDNGKNVTTLLPAYGDDLVITLNEYNNILTVKFKRIPFDFDEKILGGSKIFKLTLNAKQDFNVKDEVIKFEIFNELPSSINMVGKQVTNNALDVLKGDRAYPDSIILSFSKSSLKYDYELLLFYPNDDMITLTNSNLTLEEDGLYKLVINYKGYLNGCSQTFSFRITNTEYFKFSVTKLNDNGTYSEVSTTGNAYSFTLSTITYQIINHYIVNTEYEIVKNNNLDLVVSLYEVQPNDEYTTIYEITNINSKTNSPKSYDLIAVTKLPKTDDILRRLLVYGGNIDEQNNDLIRLNLSTRTAYVTTEDEYDAGIRIAWPKYNIIKENLIFAEVYYGDLNTNPLKVQLSEVNNFNSITLKTSGIYYIKFTDIAGNTHLFGNSAINYRDSEYITIRYLSSVIYEINEEIPINYAIYNGEVNITVPEYTLSYYAVNGKPKINVEFNGEPYIDYKTNKKYDYVFTSPGLYKVWFSAKINEDAIYEAPIYFTILSEKESRLNYLHSSYANYYIEDVLKNGISQKEKLFNINSGEMYGKYLKSLNLSSSDYKTGKGSWTFVINTNNEFNQTFTYTVWINNPSIPIEVSSKNGSTTTDIISIKFNTENLLEVAGDCILNISGYDPLVITSELLKSGDIKDVYDVQIDKKGNYYIEVTTLSGQLLYTYYVVKADPLNAVSIIIITISSIVVLSGIVVFVIMRRKMKIR